MRISAAELLFERVTSRSERDNFLEGKILSMSCFGSKTRGRNIVKGTRKCKINFSYLDCLDSSENRSFGGIFFRRKKFEKNWKCREGGSHRRIWARQTMADYLLIRVMHSRWMIGLRFFFNFPLFCFGTNHFWWNLKSDSDFDIKKSRGGGASRGRGRGRGASARKSAGRG